MKHSKILVVLVIALLALGSFTATFAQDPTVAPTEVFVPSSEGTLTIWADEGKIKVIEEIGAKFTEQFSIPVRVQLMQFGGIRDNLILGGPVGEGPDLIVGAHDWLGQLYGNGLVAPLELPEEVLANLDPVAVTAFTYDGKLVGLPYLTEAIALYYNTDVISEVPDTWQGLTDLAAQLVTDGKVERGLAIPGPGDPFHHYPLFTGFGGYVFGRDAEGNYNPEDVGLDSAGGLLAVEELDRLVKADVLNAAVDYGAAQALFQDGKLAMWITGPWALSDLRKGTAPFAVAPIPTMVEGIAPSPFVGSHGFMINSFSKNLLLAQAFLTDFIATDEAMKALYDAKPFIPAWLPLKDSIDDQDLINFGASVANGQPMPAIPQMSAVWTAWSNALTLIYQQSADPDAAITEAAEAVRAEIAKSQ